MAFYFQESSPYRDPVNKVLENLVEAGINYKILTDALSRMEFKDTMQGPEKLDIRGAVPAFVALLLFGCISIIVFKLEFSTTLLQKMGLRPDTDTTTQLLMVLDDFVWTITD